MEFRALLLIVAAAAISCSPDRPKTATKATTAGGEATVVQTGKDRGTVSMANPGGGSTTAEYEARKIPADWPKDVPLLKDARPVMALKSANGPQLTIMTAEPTPSIVTFYQAELPANGWKIDTSRVAGGDARLTAGKGKQSAVVSVIDRGSERQVTINVMNQ